MSILSSVSMGKANQSGARIVIAGQEKVGKTTLACTAPRALLIPLEQGFRPVKVNETPMLRTFNEVNALLSEIEGQVRNRQFPFKTAVFDSGSALERLIHEHVISTDPAWKTGNPKGVTMATALGGYGKAYLFSNTLFSNFLWRCDQLALAGINIIITCHVFAGKVIDPTFGEYDSWDLLLHSPKDGKTYGKRELISQWADLIGFLYEPMFILKGGEKSNFAQGVSANVGRMLGLERTPSYVSGNRFGMKGEIQIGQNCSWNYLAQAIHSASGLDLFNRDV